MFRQRLDVVFIGNIVRQVVFDIIAVVLKILRVQIGAAWNIDECWLSIGVPGDDEEGIGYFVCTLTSRFMFVVAKHFDGGLITLQDPLYLASVCLSPAKLLLEYSRLPRQIFFQFICTFL